MTWMRNGSFPLIPSGLEITIVDKDWRNSITIKGEDSQTAERMAETILCCLNRPPHVGSDVKADHAIAEVKLDPSVA